MKRLRKKDGRITSKTKDDFLRWVQKKRIAEQAIHAKVLATWADDGGQSISIQSHPDHLKKESEVVVGRQ